MNLYEFADSLRKTADKIEKMTNDLQVPTQGRFSIPEAFAKLRLVCGEEVYISIRTPELDSHRASDKIKVGKWSVYLGATSSVFHEGATLGEAVEKAIAAYHLAKNPEIANADAEETIREVTEAFSEPAPL